MHHPVTDWQQDDRTIERRPGSVRMRKGLLPLVLLAGLPAAAPAQINLAYSGATGSSNSGSAAVASSAYGGSTPVHVPTFRAGRYGPGGRTRFAEGSGYFRPYTLSPRPKYRTEIGAQPIRRLTFSLGYISHGGYGSYYY